MPITLLLVDDADMLREAIRSLLSGSPEIEIVGEASNFTDALRLANQLKPQVILLDLHMHDRAPANLKYLLPLQESRLLTMSLDSGTEGQALADSLGASALLDKVYLSDELILMILKLAPH